MKVKFGDFFEFEGILLFWQVSTLALIALIFYLIANIDKLEQLISFFSKYLRFFWKKAEYGYVKYNVQSKLNSYIKKTSKKTKNIAAIKAELKWIDKDQTPETFIENNKIVLRMHKSNNQNQNLVNATMIFVSKGFLRTAKSYISKSQREAIDIFVCYDILKSERTDIVQQFIQDFMKEKMDKTKISNFFDKYFQINEVGIFYPILVQELTFLGQKVFARKREHQKIYNEVNELINYLFVYAKRKINEDIITEFNGYYCKFAIRIVGKKYKVEKFGKNPYVKNIKKTVNEKEIETIYLISSLENKDFAKVIYKSCEEEIGFTCIQQESYKGKIRGRDNDEWKDVDTHLLVLRKNNAKVYHR